MKRFLSIIFITFVAVINLPSQCISGGCDNGKGVYLYKDGSKYIGKFAMGKRHGMGTYFYTDGSRYQGEWENDVPNGEGVKIEAGGQTLVGRWENGLYLQDTLRDQDIFTSKGGSDLAEVDLQSFGCIEGDCLNGEGTYLYPSGAIYNGNFENGEVHGMGVCRYADGSEYKGEWVHRYPEGRGTRVSTEGEKRVGYWYKGYPIDQYGNIEPDWTQLLNEDDIQTGCITGDCQQGEGIYAYQDGSRFEGYFKGMKPVKGKFFYPNGDQYEGELEDGVPHGQGKLSYEMGRELDGYWLRGAFVGKQKDFNPYGCVEGDCENGWGVYVFRAGVEYKGTFANGLPDGRGITTYPNGDKYEGEMKSGNNHGNGTLYMANGEVVKGMWENGTYVGQSNSAPAYTTTKNSLNVWAVVIGVSSYNHMPALRYTDDDAYRFYAFLKSPEGGALSDDRIALLIDEEATKSNILKAMGDVFRKAGKNDLLLFYFSGHGLKGAFLPIDYDGFNNQLLHQEVTDLFDSCPAKYKLCIADACHSGSLLGIRGTDPSDIIQNYYTTLSNAQKGTAFITSSKADETSIESSGLRQGVFSHFLIRGLKGDADANVNDLISIQELFDYVQENVRSYTRFRQTPLIKGDYDADMTVGVKRK